MRTVVCLLSLTLVTVGHADSFLDIKGFDSIRVDGKWEVDIEHSNEFLL